MTRIFTVRLLVAAAMFAPAIVTGAAGQNAQTTAPVKARPALTIPKDAVANADGTWSYTDKQGKHWTYSNTPFGVLRVEADAAANAKLPAGLPKGAVRDANGNFAWTDRDGKKWVYVSTPFGFSRAAATSPGRDWKVEDLGDTVRFERLGPMGAVVWEKKKTDLSDEERTVYESQQSAPQKSAAQTAEPR